MAAPVPTISASDILSALQTALGPSSEGRTVVQLCDFMAEQGFPISRGRMREALRELILQGKVKAVRVQRYRLDGISTIVSAYVRC